MVRIKSFRNRGSGIDWTAVGRAVRVVAPVILFAFIVWMVGAGDVMTRLGAADPGWMFVALLACSAQIVLCAFRWRSTAARLGAPIGIGRAVAEYYLSSAVNTTVPGGVAGDALRAVRTQGVARFETAAQAVVIERLAGQVALGAVLLLGLALSGRPELQWWAAVATGVALLLAALIAVVRPAVPDRLVPAVFRRFGSALKSSWFDRREAVFQSILSLLIVAANLTSFAAAARATGTAIGFPDVFFAVPLILAAMLVPFSVAGWGYREGAAAAVFPLIGASAVAGVSASVVFGAVFLVASLPGAVILLLRTREAQWAPDGRVAAKHDPAE
ncbi:lysylphosphatidylglycerol synthase transmembrane domain-containing protein [Tropicimonas aquimaris]|uniref:YbhN family protein n=1 Tax=Tropicimonas aquimaris TaxID=914152 RepID=A0ABW3IUI3_9RHOB